MKHILPKNNLQLVVKHHNTDCVANQNEHLVVHIRVLVDIPPHCLSRIVVLSAAQLITVFAHLLLRFMQFAQVYAV